MAVLNLRAVPQDSFGPNETRETLGLECLRDRFDFVTETLNYFVLFLFYGVFRPLRCEAT